MIGAEQINFLVAEPDAEHYRRDQHVARPRHPESLSESRVLQPSESFHGIETEHTDSQVRIRKQRPLEPRRRRDIQCHLKVRCIEITDQARHIGVRKCLVEKMRIGKHIILRSHLKKFGGIGEKIHRESIAPRQ